MIKVRLELGVYSEKIEYYAKEIVCEENIPRLREAVKITQEGNEYASVIYVVWAIDLTSVDIGLKADYNPKSDLIAEGWSRSKPR